MTYEQLEKIELYNHIAQFNRNIIKVCRTINQYNGRYKYMDELNEALNKFKEFIPLDIDSLDLRFDFCNIEALTIYKNGEPIDLKLDREIGYTIYETEYSMSIFEPEDITNGIIFEAFICARNENRCNQLIKLSGIEDKELDFLNYDDLIDMVERLGQIDIYKFDHRIEDDILIINYGFHTPKQVFI